jgi:RNA polymerase sigma-70 factor (sigma-E family)
MDDRDKGFTEYFAGRGAAFLGTAFLLCGNWHRAEDLVQTTFLKLYRAWHRIGRHEALDAYTRQILVRTFLHEARGGFFRREQVSDEQADRVAPAADSLEDRMVLLHALAKVPPRQRATLVLRFWEDMSVEETARVLGSSTGTVKSQTARGLANLRGLIPNPNVMN